MRPISRVSALAAACCAATVLFGTGPAAAAVPADGEFGPACAALPQGGSPGSVQTMAGQPVADAAAGNPLLSTLATAVKQGGLVDTLNNADGVTVFAPTNEAFAKIPKAELDKVLADKEQLRKVLSYHVVAGRTTPDQLDGSHKTLEGQDLTVTGSGADFTVNDTAKVVCGNVQTRNGTVYVIDSVLMPPS